MADAKHTPGPWSVNEDALTVEAGDITVCTVEPADKGAIFLVSHGITEANARLIAAAPRMLEALRHAEDWINSVPHGDNCFVSAHYEGDPGDRCNCGKDSALQAVQEAIADATGEDE